MKRSQEREKQRRDGKGRERYETVRNGTEREKEVTRRVQRREMERREEMWVDTVQNRIGG